MPICGRAKIGKSFLANGICEIAGLYDHPFVGKLDIDEKNDRDFLRYHGSAFPMPMRDFDDITKIVNLLPTGCRLALCDTPGAFQNLAVKITEKQDFLVESNITFVPILVTLDQAEAGPLIQSWLEIFQHCKTAFIIQNVIQDPCGLTPAPLVLPAGLPMSPDVKIMRMPYLHFTFANEMSKVAARIMQVIDGDIEAKESEILAMPATRRFVSAWALQAEIALAPLVEYILKTIQNEPVPMNGKPASKNPKAATP